MTDPSAADRRAVAVEGVRFSLWRADPQRRRRTPPVLLLHGVPQTAAIWRDLVPALCTDRVVLAPDLKGLGASEPRAPYDVPTLVRELAALVLHEVEGLPGDGRIDVVGHDWGGSLAIALASARPDLIRRLVVINAPYRKIDLLRAFHIPLLALPWLPEFAFRLGGERLVRTMIGYGWKAPHRPDSAALDHYAAAYADPVRVRAMLGYYRASARLQALAALRRVTSAGPDQSVGESRLAPERTLVIWGADDPVLPLPVGEAVVSDVARAEGVGPGTVSMLSVPGAGHFVVEEAPEVVVPAIAEFLRAD